MRSQQSDCSLLRLACTGPAGGSDTSIDSFYTSPPPTVVSSQCHCSPLVDKFQGKNTAWWLLHRLWQQHWFSSIFHQIGPLGRVGLVVTECVCVSVCLSVCPLPMQFFCVVGLVQRVPRPWTGAISISSRALKRGCVSEFNLNLDLDLDLDLE